MTHHEPAGGKRRAQLRFSIDHWAAFWANPHPELVGRIVTPDVVGCWPGDAEPVRGVTRYKGRIAQILTRVPDLRLDVAEHATNVEFLFVRWIARGAGVAGSFTFSGVDRIQLRDGLIRQNLVYYDPGLFESAINGQDHEHGEP